MFSACSAAIFCWSMAKSCPLDPLFWGSDTPKVLGRFVALDPMKRQLRKVATDSYYI
jgi:hypothetical protein